MVTPSRQRVGPYELFAPIASGGFGQVFLARKVAAFGFTRPVALKCLHEGRADDQAVLSMFIDEARIASKIQHRNVASVIDVFEHDKRLWLAMEFVQGEALSRLLERSAELGSQVPLPICAGIALGLLEGLHAAHEATDDRGAPLAVVHRDVSPHNVIVSVHGIVKVVDFGIAKSAGRVAVTRDGHVKGKLAYMAIEQLAGGEVDRRCDLFAAGVVLWELIAGTRLFTSTNPDEVVERPEPKELSARLPRGGQALREVVERALTPAVKKRFQTAAEMAAAIEAATTVATARELADWLASLAGPSLERQASLLADLDSERPRSSRPPPAPELVTESAVVVSPKLPAPLEGSAPEVGSPHEEIEEAPISVRGAMKRYGPLAFLGGGAVTALVVLGLVLAFRGGAASSAAPTVSTSPAAEPAPVAPAASESPTRASATVETPSETPSAESALGGQASAAAPLRPAAGPRPSASVVVPKAAIDGCDPPYVLDDRGVKRIKPECVR